MTDPDGNLTGFRGTGRDITEWLKVMDALRESERRCRELAGDGSACPPGFLDI